MCVLLVVDISCGVYCFFFSSRRRHTRCALVTGVQRVLFRSIAGSPLEQADAAIILLHGRGQPAQTMLDLARQIDLPTIAWVAPQAPAGAWYTPKYDAFDTNGDTSVSDACTALAEISQRLEEAGVALDRPGLSGLSPNGRAAGREK